MGSDGRPNSVWSGLGGLYFFTYMILFIYLFIFGCAGSVAALLFSSCSQQGQGLRGGGGSAGVFSLQCPLLLGSLGSRHAGFSSSDMWVQ